MSLSIIVPAYREPYLNKTISSLLSNSTGDIEILVVFDGYVPADTPQPDLRVKVITLDKNFGMRGAINAGLANATKDYLMKIDAHCCVGQGYDEILTGDCLENWLMIPRRYSINEVDWDKSKERRPKDYHYLVFPEITDHTYGYAFQVAVWDRRNRERFLIDDTMAFQGSGWVANRKYFMEHVGFLDDNPETYGSFSQDQQEVGLKYWMGGGEIKVNKKTWYAHLQKRGHHYNSGQYSRKHKKDKQRTHGDEWGTRHWVKNEESGMIHPFSWLIEKFNPPSWPPDWQEILDKHYVDKY